MLLFTASSDTRRIARPAGPWGLAVPTSSRPYRAPPEPRIRGDSMGTGIGPEGWRTTQGLLQELHSRAKRAQSLLGNLVDKHKKFFDVSTEAIIDVFDLSADKANTLREFAQKMMDLIDRAYLQAETKLQKLLNALENTNITIEVESGKKTIHIFPSSERERARWYISAHYQKNTWIYRLPIHRISEHARFPDILNLSEKDLIHLQRGWRASDESEDKKGNAEMTTTKKWQIVAWAATRPGLLWIYVDSLNLNVKMPTMQFLIVSSWQQQWPGRDGKKQAKQEVEQEQHPLELLTWYLGDGLKVKGRPEFFDGEIPRRRPITREEAKIMLEFAYKTNFGKLMDILECDKWKLLKSFVDQKQQFPIHATFNGYTFWLDYNNNSQSLYARAYLKDIKEAERLKKTLEEIGIKSKIYTVKNRYLINIQGREIIKLAEQNKEWRIGIKQLAHKRALQPKSKMLKMLLELAENPPLARYK